MSKITPIQTRSSLDVEVASKSSISAMQIEAPVTEQDLKDSRSTMLILDHPEVTPVPHVRSVGLISKMRDLGMHIQDVPYSIYNNPKSVGQPLKFDVKSEMMGYENLYTDVSHFEKIFSEVQALARSLYEKSSKIVEQIENDAIPDEKLTLDQRIALSEAPDAESISTIRTKALGWFLDSPVAMDIVTTPPDPKWTAVLQIVADRYADALNNGKAVTASGEPLPHDITLRMNDQDLRDLDSDPSDTLTGLPVLASGIDSIPTRIAMLASSPDMKNINGSKWLEDYSINISRSCGVPPEVALGSTIANRTSAFRKTRLVWKVAPGGYVADMQVRGLGARVRNVFPVPFPINYALAPCYKQMSTARMKIRGLWHSPKDWNIMLKDLTMKGKVIVSADFSGMDTRISPSAVQTIALALLKSGFSKFACEVLANVQKVMSVFTPSYTATPGSSTRMSGVIPWLSGYKLTSEIDTIYGIATTLTALSSQPVMKDVVSRWVKGDFVLYELGDDTIFTLTKEENDNLDWDQFEKDAKKQVGAVVKKDVAPVFLKKIILSESASPRMIARVIQQTFFNENRNDNNPAIVSLIGLKARLEGLSAHPWYDEFFPVFMNIVEDLAFMKELGVSQLKPDTPLSAEHNNLLVAYASSLDGKDWMAQLYEQAKYSKSAMDALLLVQNALGSDALAMGEDRKLYREALLRTPTTEEAALLFKAKAKFFR